jgi:1-phosphofructokinase family hexose kinase
VDGGHRRRARKARRIVLIATPNPCFDATIRLPSLSPGTVSRATATTTTAGGKGVNVARAAQALGEPHVRLATILPDQDGARYGECLSREGTTLLSVSVPGAIRTAVILLEDAGRVTVVNGPGAQIDEDCWDRFCDMFLAAVAPAEVVACSGSLPPGAPEDGYAQLTRAARGAGSRIVVDAAPPALAAALPYHPHLVCPNLSEAEGLLHARTDEQVDEIGADVPDRAVAAARNLHAAGAELAVVTAGSAGAGFAHAGGSGWEVSPTVDVVNPIGAGDAFVAGAAHALGTGLGIEAVVRYGLTTASASCETPLAGALDPIRAADLRRSIAADQSFEDPASPRDHAARRADGVGTARSAGTSAAMDGFGVTDAPS